MQPRPLKLFLSYASEDRPVAEEIQLALAGAGHRVFYDKGSLPAAGDYHGRIQRAVREADAFIYLISPASVAKGNYALTELKFARDKWPHPKERILPVRLHDTPWEAVPAYLKSITVLEPEGNVAAEVAAAVAHLADRLGSPAGDDRDVEREPRQPTGRKKWWMWGLGAFIVLALLAEYAPELFESDPAPMRSASPPAAPPFESGEPRSTAPAGVDRSGVTRDRGASGRPAADIEIAQGRVGAETPQAQASRTAQEILQLLHAARYEQVWSTRTSAFFRSQFSKSVFMTNMYAGAQARGQVLDSRLVNTAYTQQDAATGVRGEIYAFDFLNTYAGGRYQERVVLLQEQDGVFRLAGLWAVPAP